MDWPGASGSASTGASTWTTTWYRSPGAPGSIPEWRAVSASRASASACCWAMVGVSAETFFGYTFSRAAAAVLVLIHVQGPARVPPGGLAGLGLPIHSPPAAHDALD